jgi:hypothetical protein
VVLEHRVKDLLAVLEAQVVLLEAVAAVAVLVLLAQQV